MNIFTKLFKKQTNSVDILDYPNEESVLSELTALLNSGTSFEFMVEYVSTIKFTFLLKQLNWNVLDREWEFSGLTFNYKLLATKSNMFLRIKYIDYCGKFMISVSKQTYTTENHPSRYC